jgi:hypothetical protein
MIDAWWAQETSKFVGLLIWVGPIDGLLGWLASRGRYRAAVLTAWTGIMILYGLIGAAGVLALVTGQPSDVWVSMTVVGLVISLLHWFLRGIMKSAFLQAELRRSIARDL